MNSWKLQQSTIVCFINSSQRYCSKSNDEGKIIRPWTQNRIPICFMRLRDRIYWFCGKPAGSFVSEKSSLRIYDLFSMSEHFIYWTPADIENKTIIN